MGIFQTNYKKLSDENLMRYICEGDNKAFGELYDRYAKAMLNYFFRMLWKDREKAEDFVQDLFAKIVKKPESFNPERAFKTWFYSIANNMCKNEYKKQEVRSGTRNGLDESYNVTNDSRAADKLTDDKFIGDAIQNALAQLDDKHREVFELRYMEQLSIKEISETIDKSEGTVKSRLFYATKKLAGELEEFKYVLKN
jgi:RNA polymerase sigma-70 factor (ECF subfamily)